MDGILMLIDYSPRKIIVVCSWDHHHPEGGTHHSRSADEDFWDDLGPASGWFFDTVVRSDSKPVNGGEDNAFVGETWPKRFDNGYMTSIIRTAAHKVRTLLARLARETAAGSCGRNCRIPDVAASDPASIFLFPFSWHTYIPILSLVALDHNGSMLNRQL